MKDELIKLFLSHIKEYDVRCFYGCFSRELSLTSDKSIEQMSPMWFAEIMAARCLNILQDESSKNEKQTNKR